MERNYDEVISEILIQLDNMEKRMEKADKRMALTINVLLSLNNGWSYLIRNWRDQ
jgi:hypothetical protein